MPCHVRHTRLSRRIGRLHLPLLCLLAVHGAQARTWLCGLDETATALVCVADRDATDAGSGTAALPPPAGPAVTARVRGTAFPLDAGRVWRVPLWTPPSDHAWLQLLAQATICYRSPGCEVVLADGDRLPAQGRPVASGR